MEIEQAQPRNIIKISEKYGIYKLNTFKIDNKFEWNIMIMINTDIVWHIYSGVHKMQTQVRSNQLKISI